MENYLAKYIELLMDKYEGRLPKGVQRSPLWRKVRKEHLEKYPNCYACGGTKKCQVHHIIPVSVDQSLELEPSNLVTLCRAKKYGVDCHLFFGHFGYFKIFNPTVIEDIDRFQWARDKVARHLGKNSFWKIGKTAGGLAVKISNIWSTKNPD